MDYKCFRRSVIKSHCLIDFDDRFFRHYVSISCACVISLLSKIGNIMELSLPDFSEYGF